MDRVYSTGLSFKWIAAFLVVSLVYFTIPQSYFDRGVKKVIHSIPRTSSLQGTSAVATPYNMIPGGGERYLLSMVRAMQSMGEVVDILVFPGNVADRQAVVADTARKLNIDIDWSRAGFSIVKRNRTHITTPLPTYRFFVLMGNEKIPSVTSIGDMNIYMNQFPFDQDRKYRGTDALKVTSYDFVVVNSEYTRKWYKYYTRELFAKLQASHPLPQIVVIYPPVGTDSIYGETGKLRVIGDTRKPWIVMTGRFFGDLIQGKRHLEAIEAFRLLKKETTLKNVKLILIGYQMPGKFHLNYTSNVIRQAEKVGDVHVLINLDGRKLSRILSVSSVVWSMTGGFGENPNPADAEHFGIGVLEAASLGCIPLVVSRGGLRETVSENASHMCSSTLECATKTAGILDLPRHRFDDLRKRWSAFPRKFSNANFDRHILDIFASGNGLARVHSTVKQHLGLRNIYLPQLSTLAAVIVETRECVVFKSIVLHTMYMLGNDWRLIVYHGTKNAQFVRDALSSIHGVVYRNVNKERLNDHSYNSLLKEPETWRYIQSLHVEKVLVFQVDSLLLQRNYQPFLKWDYIGAPWKITNSAYVGINEAGMSIPSLSRELRVGNGGLSIRTVEAMLSIASMNLTSDPDEQEDLFFVRNMHKFGYRVASLEAASRFALEVMVPEIDVNDVFGIHQSWLYVNEKVHEALISSMLKSIYNGNKKLSLYRSLLLAVQKLTFKIDKNTSSLLSASGQQQ